MSVVINVERIEKAQAVRFVKGNKEVESVIRGWTNLPLDHELNLDEDTYVVKYAGGVVALNTDAYKRDFREVIEADSSDSV